MDGVILGDLVVDESILSKPFWPCHPPDTARCANRCCVIGCLLTRREIERIEDHLDELVPYMLPRAIRRLKRLGFYFRTRKPTEWDLEPVDEQGFKTRVVDGWCIFFTGQPTGPGCVLQSFAAERGLHPWTLKPRDGWLFPIRPIRRGRLYVSDNWDLPCLEDEHNVGAPPVYVTCRTELSHLLGEDGYAQLVGRVRARR